MAISLFTPCIDYLLVRVLEEPADVRGVIAPYGRHADTPMRAEVLAAGPGEYDPQNTRSEVVDAKGTIRVVPARKPMPCQVGDVVVLQLNAGTEIRWQGETYRMVLARDLFGVE